MSKIVIECDEKKYIEPKAFHMYLIKGGIGEKVNVKLAILLLSEVLLIDTKTAELTYCTYPIFEDYYNILRDVTDNFEITITKEKNNENQKS